MDRVVNGIGRGHLAAGRVNVQDDRFDLFVVGRLPQLEFEILDHRLTERSGFHPGDYAAQRQHGDFVGGILLCWNDELLFKMRQFIAAETAAGDRAAA